MILNLQNVHKTFNRQVVIDHLDWQIEFPKIVALVAPNGSGKTTLLDIIANLKSADEGQVTIFNRRNNDPKIYLTMTYMQNNSVLFQNMTGEDHLSLIKHHYRISDIKFQTVIDRVGIAEYLRKRVCYYSMGMKQLLLFAMAILPETKLLLLDEPLNGLDPKSIVMVRETLQMLYQQGVTIIFSSHNLDEIDRLTSDIFFLHHGKLVSAVANTSECYAVIMEGGKHALKDTKWEAYVTEELTPNKFILDVLPAELIAFKATFRKSSTPVLDITLKKKSTEKQYFDLFSSHDIH
ncbi:ABC transporter ATP-binding protein [Lacticaseibacillus paracasei]|uniref:ABC transporter ATP-binding protein n=1 Tax=Lacticaseibacillus paracasei TaxID=1597 RepID=UPI0021CEF723|nr:ABC transporter ATP-binding protein [Lacticaseibacillus paracasei]MCU6431185.1 ABC transporter ATP-binding protein [Lacticaseibacillus paracasei]